VSPVSIRVAWLLRLAAIFLAAQPDKRPAEHQRPTETESISSVGLIRPPAGQLDCGPVLIVSIDWPSFGKSNGKMAVSGRHGHPKVNLCSSVS
jgi:hypothetical protein